MDNNAAPQQADINSKLDITAPKVDQPALDKDNNNLILKNHFNSILIEPTKYVLLGTFILYFTGFIIWHFYLAKFGVAGIGFLQVEYISASLCFLFIFCSLSVPPFVVAQAMKKTILSGGGLRNFYKWDTSYSYTTIFIWYYLNNRLIELFFPNSKLTPNGEIIQTTLYSMFVIHSIFGVFLYFKAGGGKFIESGKNAVYSEKQVALRKSKLYKYLFPVPYAPLYFVLLTFVNLVFNKEIDKAFLFVTVIYWYIFFTEPGIHIKKIWPTSTVLLRCMICIGLFLSFIIYLRIFSLNQFEKIPKSVGGGKGEIAYFTLSPDHHATAGSINLSEVKNMGSTNSLFGPVGIILKTEKEITFINYAETNMAAKITNSIRFVYKTNSIMSHSNKTNIIRVTSIATNKVYDVVPNIFYNSGGLAARQMRLDLIDGIIYNR